MVLPAVLGAILWLITGNPDYLVIIGVLLVLGAALDTAVYPFAVRWQPPWMTGVLAIFEFGLLLVLGSLLELDLELRQCAAALHRGVAAVHRHEDRAAADLLADLPRVGRRVPPHAMVDPARQGAAAGPGGRQRGRAAPGQAAERGVGGPCPTAAAGPEPLGRTPDPDRGAPMTMTLPPPDTALDPGERVGGYCVVRMLGEGGMGRVYEAVDGRGQGRRPQADQARR